MYQVQFCTVRGGVGFIKLKLEDVHMNFSPQHCNKITRKPIFSSPNGGFVVYGESTCEFQSNENEVNKRALKLPAKTVERETPVIRVRDTPSYLGISKSSYYNFTNPKSPYYKEGFPDVIELGDNSKGHFRVELDAWLEFRVNRVIAEQVGV